VKKEEEGNENSLGSCLSDSVEMLRRDDLTEAVDTTVEDRLNVDAVNLRDAVLKLVGVKGGAGRDPDSSAAADGECVSSTTGDELKEKGKGVGGKGTRTRKTRRRTESARSRRATLPSAGPTAYRRVASDSQRTASCRENLHGNDGSAREGAAERKGTASKFSNGNREKRRTHTAADQASENRPLVRRRTGSEVGMQPSAESGKGGSEQHTGVECSPALDDPAGDDACLRRGGSVSSRRAAETDGRRGKGAKERGEMARKGGKRYVPITMLNAMSGRRLTPAVTGDHPRTDWKSASETRRSALVDYVGLEREQRTDGDHIESCIESRSACPVEKGARGETTVSKKPQ
jgi:hypothetical protein